MPKVSLLSRLFNLGKPSPEPSVSVDMDWDGDVLIDLRYGDLYFSVSVDAERAAWAFRTDTVKRHGSMPLPKE